MNDVEVVNTEGTSNGAAKDEGVAKTLHDLSNLVTGLVGYAEMARADLDQRERVKHCLDKIVEVGLRSRDLVRDHMTVLRYVDDTTPTVGDSGIMPAPSARRAPENRVKRILFVDDDPTLLRLGQTMLARMGHQPTTTDAAHFALELLARDRGFDLVVTDVVMEGLNGIALLKHIRMLDDTIPVLVMSGYDIPEEDSLRTWARPCRCISKPFSYAGLAGMITELLHDSAQLRAAGRRQ